MFCPNCGNQIPDNSFFCPSCGVNLQKGSDLGTPVNLENQSEFSFAAILRRALCSGKFLAMCILVTAAAVLSFAATNVVMSESGSSSSISVDVWGIITSVAMWITYANAKNSTPIMSVSGLKFNAALAKITVVFNWIGAVCLTLCGILFMILGPTVNMVFSDEAAMEELMNELTISFEAMGLGEYIEMITGELLSIIYIVAAVVFLIGSIAMIVFNIVYYGKVKNFANNLVASYLTNKETDLRYSTISVWFMVMGILGIVGSISTLFVIPMAAVSSISGSVAMIVASTWVRELGEEISQPANVQSEEYYE